MCTRYMLLRPGSEVGALLGIESFPETGPRYNAAPGQSLPVVRRGRQPGRKREAAALRWGLVPAWSTEPAMPTPLINARAETAAEKPAFRDAIRHRRCAVPADGFYEWKRTAHGPMPWLFEDTAGGLLLLAGLWERWAGASAEPFDSFAVLTTEPNTLVAPLHDRMPALIPADALDEWLDAATPPARLSQLLAPCPAARLRTRAVNPRLNNVANDDASCLAPPPPQPPAAHQLDFGIG
jgi:putative SOS response-associated peptidase YedK